MSVNAIQSVCFLNNIHLNCVNNWQVLFSFKAFVKNSAATHNHKAAHPKIPVCTLANMTFVLYAAEEKGISNC